MADDIAKLAAAVAARQADHAAARQTADQARSAETQALNNLNDAQHEFDRAIHAMREEASRESDWGRRGLKTAASHG